MTVTMEAASKAADSGLEAYVRQLDETMARPSEQVGALPPPDAPAGAEPAAKSETVEAPTVSGDDMLPIVAILGKVATTRAQVDALTDQEARDLADAVAPVADKYAGHVLAQYSEEAALLFVLYMVAQPRIEQWRERKRAEEAAEAASREAGAGDGPEPMASDLEGSR